MPSFGGENIAPNLDRFGKEGILFTNFYSNSFRTDRALTSIISGYPAQPSTSIMKFTEKIERLPSLSKTMKNAGYDIAYYYGGDANFTNMRAYLVSAGFERIVCDKDFPLSERTGKWGAHDHLVFEKLLADLRTEKTNRPLLRILQTSSSHEPFDVPFHKFNDKAANAFAYTDQCLGSFVEELRRSPMWKNTVVVLVPDHQGCYPPNLDNPVERHHIPLVIIGGAVKKPLRIDTYASQIDIAATLLCQLGLPHDDFTFSKNILNPASPHFGYFTEPSLFGMITDKKCPRFQLRRQCHRNRRRKAKNRQPRIWQSILAKTIRRSRQTIKTENRCLNCSTILTPKYSCRSMGCILHSGTASCKHSQENGFGFPCTRQYSSSF